MDKLLLLKINSTAIAAMLVILIVCFRYTVFASKEERASIIYKRVRLLGHVAFVVGFVLFFTKYLIRTWL